MKSENSESCMMHACMDADVEMEAHAARHGSEGLPSPKSMLDVFQVLL